MAVQVLDILPPVGGLNRAVGFQSESPYFYSDGLNYWSRDVFEQRERGGSRPGLIKAFPTGVTGPVHLLANVRAIESGDSPGSTETHFLREFNFAGSTYSSEWIAPLDMQRPDSDRDFAYLPISATGYAIAASENAAPFESRNTKGLIAPGLGQVVGAGSLYTIRMSLGVVLLQQVSGAFNEITIHGIYSIFLRMDDNSPNVRLNGVVVEMDFQTLRMRILQYVGGTETELASVTINNYHQDVTVKVENNLITATGGANTASATAPTPAAGKRVGFSMGGPFRQSGGPGSVDWRRIDNFGVNYKGDAPAVNRNVVVAAGGTDAGSGTTVDLRFENNPNALTTPTAHALTNPKARQLQATELLGRLFVVGEDTSWQFNPSGDGTLAALTITDVSAGCIAIAAWRTRLCVVPHADQHNIHMSKVGSFDPPTWVYSALPVGSAVTLNTTGIDAGKVGEPINCLIAHSDDYLAIGCLNSLYVLRGDPTYGGQIDRLSSSIGIVAPQAWARGPNGETVILSNDGLYGIPPQIGGFPESISREALPQELRDADVKNYRVLMAYDVRNRGVFIGLTPIIGSGGTYWWFDWQKRGFHPMTFNASHEPTALVYRNADAATDQRLLFGCRDGHVRAMNDNAFDDDGVAFKSRVLIGPIALGGGGYYDGMIREIVGQTGLGSANVTCSVQIGNSIEAARKATPRAPFTLRQGKNLTHRPNLRGNACYLLLEGTPPWTTELITLTRERLGKQRL